MEAKDDFTSRIADGGPGGGAGLADVLVAESSAAASTIQPDQHYTSGLHVVGASQAQGDSVARLAREGGGEYVWLRDPDGPARWDAWRARHSSYNERPRVGRAPGTKLSQRAVDRQRGGLAAF